MENVHALPGNALWSLNLALDEMQGAREEKTLEAACQRIQKAEGFVRQVLDVAMKADAELNGSSETTESN
jgi:hypothetical protein